MKKVLIWARQPTTLLACAIVAAGVAYWLTRSAAIAAGIAAAILGGVNDHTQDLLTRMEAIEDTARQVVAIKSAAMIVPAVTAASAAMTDVKPVTILAIAGDRGSS